MRPRASSGPIRPQRAEPGACAEARHTTLAGVLHLLFDNDGVLVDSERLYFEANRQVLAERGVVMAHADFIELSLTRGVGAFELIPDLAPGEEEALRAERNRRYDRLLLDAGAADGLVIPGVPAVLDALEAHPRAIVTSSRKDHFASIHRHSGLLPRFAFVLAKGDYARTKPHPDPYLVAAARFEVEPGRCLVIEDSPRGLASALAAGMRCVVVRSPFTAELPFDGAHAVIDSITDLPAVVAELPPSA